MSKATDLAAINDEIGTLFPPQVPQGLSPEERLIWLLGDMATAFENFYGAECPKRSGIINITAAKIIDNVLAPLTQK